MKTLLYEKETIEAYKTALASSKNASLAFALITNGGLDLIKNEIEQLLKRGGNLRFLVGVDMPSDPQAIGWLINLQKSHSNMFKLKIFQSGRKKFFHPKIGIFTHSNSKRSVILGSSNLTSGGMGNNLEANVHLEDGKVISQIDGYFEEIFEGGRAREVSDIWLKKYAPYWKKIKKLDRAQRKLQVRFSSQPAKIVNSTAPIPKRIQGACFAFTGKIYGYPRERVLYPLVIKLGGTIGYISSVNALVHGDILGGLKTTAKLKAAQEINKPIISEDEFFEAVKNENRIRSRKS